MTSSACISAQRAELTCRLLLPLVHRDVLHRLAIRIRARDGEREGLSILRYDPPCGTHNLAALLQRRLVFSSINVTVIEPAAPTPNP